MELIAKDFHFYSDNDHYIRTKKWDNLLQRYYADCTEIIATSIRIFGTQEQIEETKNKYIEKTGLALDEVYKFELEPKNSYFYNKEANDVAAMKLEIYEKMYKDNNKNPLIINLK